MYDKDSRGISYTAGFFMLICFAIAGLVLAAEIQKPVWVALTGKSVEALREGVFTPADSTAIKLIQSLTAIVGFLVPTILTASLLSRKPFKLMGYTTEGLHIRQVGLVLLLIGTGLMVASSFSHLTNLIPLPESWRTRFDDMEEKYNMQVSAIIRLNNFKDYIIALLIMGFLPALCEETLFRGGLQNFLTRGTHLPWVSIIIVSILFSLAHISFYGFLSRFFLGLVLGGLYYYSGRLWLSILAHFVNNALAITLLFVSTQQGKSLDEAMKQDTTSFWGFLAIPFVVVLFMAFKRASASNVAA